MFTDNAIQGWFIEKTVQILLVGSVKRQKAGFFCSLALVLYKILRGSDRPYNQNCFTRHRGVSEAEGVTVEVKFF